MKTRIIVFIIAVVFIFPLTSCIGIGDGALFDNVEIPEQSTAMPTGENNEVNGLGIPRGVLRIVT